ncbi:MAG: hypothetical protein QE570_09255 [Verrucomicrobiota bacterium]|nr:hypothetical protein [Verrucomicrobiota bacterium]
MNKNSLKAALAVMLLSLSVPLQATQIFNAGPSLSVIQGDRARFSAQFFDRDGNSGIRIRAEHVGSGQVIGEITRNDSTGDLEWTCDTSALTPGANLVRLIATDPAGASATVPFTLQVQAASSAQHWRQTYFGSSQASGAALDSADPDRDGLSNLAEFAFGLNPTLASSEVGTRAESPPNHHEGMRAVFRRRKDHAVVGLDYLVEFSSNLIDWIPSTAIPEVIADEGVLEKVGLPFPILPNGQQGRFFRIQLQQPTIPAE